MRRIRLALAALLALAGPAVAQQQTINLGASANDGTGDNLRAAFGKTNANFTTLFAALAGKAASVHTHVIGDVTGLQVALNGKQPLSANLTALSAFSGAGTTSSTLAAGNDSRIVGALQAANNLSDLASFTVARTNLGLGTLAVQNAASAAITGGSVNGATIGATTPGSGAFTTLSATTPLGASSGGTGAASLSLGLDAAFGSTRGNLLYRGSAGWAALGPGTSGQYLATGGAGADPAWGTPAGAGNVSTSGAPAAGQFAVFASSNTVKGVGAASFRNRLINGNFTINQRSAGAASTTYAAGAYILDRWKAGAGGVTLSFATAASGDVTVTITAGTLLQVIEGSFYLPEGGSYTSSWSGTSTCRAYQGTATGSYVASPFTVSSWTAGTNGTVECSTGTLTMAQLEPGSQATAFERRDDEIRRCQRYYGLYTGRLQSVAASTGNQVAPLHLTFGTMMRPGTINIGLITSASSGASSGYTSIANDQFGADVALAFTATNALASATVTLTASNEL
jgi:hypothetical protein